MGVREDTLKILRDGLSPKEIARAKGVSITTTLGYLDQLVGCGYLKRSEIFFSVPKDIRDLIPASLIENGSSNIQEVSAIIKRERISIDPEDAIVIIKYGNALHALGDMYENLRDIEIFLHQTIRDTLKKQYGDGEMNWWRKGIPLKIRQSCQSKREEDEDPVEEPYCYTELLDLWEILDKQWSILKNSLPDEFKDNKPILRNKIIRLNRIRREVMHPVKGVIPTEEDFNFVTGFYTPLVISGLINIIAGTA